VQENPEVVEQIGVEVQTADPGELPEGIDAIIELGVVENVMRFDREELRVLAGQTVRFDLVNTDNMEHNLLILNPGSLAEVGRLADAMIGAPDGRERLYVPDSPDVLAYTPILDPGESYQLIFEVPDEPGEYPFVCTIPGHWRIMNGILIVE
jgi:plastocyanin